MSTIQQVGLVGNSVKVQRLPAASAATYQGGNRFYTLVGSQEGYITGHTYHTILSGDSYLWEDATSQGMLTVSSESEMTALLANENTRKYVKYVGESGTYIKDQIYELVSTADAVSFYELPSLENEGTSDDIAEGKEFINSKGEKIVGTAKMSNVEIITGSILPDTSGASSIIIASIPRRPKIIAAYSNGISSSSSIWAIVSDPACANEGATSNSMWIFSGSTTITSKRYWGTFDYDETNQTVTLNAGDSLSFLRFPLPYAIAY